MTDQTREWRLIREEQRSGAMQMALDEVAAETAASGGPRTVRVYRWPDTLSLGYGQATETVDWAACEEGDIEVTRRPTGGGGIYHDSVGDISYSIAVPADDVPGELLACYKLLCEPVFTAFELLGVDATFAQEERPTCYQPACYLRAIDPAHDIMAGGRKISGNAQYRQRTAVLQHGSLSYARYPERHLSAFATDIDPNSFRSRVTSIREQSGVSREQAVETLEEALADWVDAAVGSWTDEEFARASTLANNKYASDAWIRQRKS